MLSRKTVSEQRYAFHGFYRPGVDDYPDRPFIRAVVALPRFRILRHLELIVDSGSDITTIQPKDSSLLLTDDHLNMLGAPRGLEGMGGVIDSYTEDGAVGFPITPGQIYWIPIRFDITDPWSGSSLPSALGNDVMNLGRLTLEYDSDTVMLEFDLEKPIITREY